MFLFLFLFLYIALNMSEIPVGDPAAGAKIFKQRCAQCHTTEKVELGNCVSSISLFFLLHPFRTFFVSGRKTQDGPKSERGFW